MTTKKQFFEIFESIDFEKIIDHPNILIAANFWDNERYQAARTCYKFMRAIDDLIDNYKAENRGIAERDRHLFISDVEKWLDMLFGRGESSGFQVELVSTVEKFRIPRWPLEDFATSMLYDVNHDGFATLGTFIDYSRGATVAPASIFVHLAGLQEADGVYSDPPFDVRSTALPCAMFSYLVHIIRDFRKDQLNNLNYFADDLAEKSGLTRYDLNRMAHGEPLTGGFRQMINEYYTLADKYRLETIDVMNRVCPTLSPRYRLSMEIIFDLYMMVFERIDIERGTFLTEELNPTPGETRERVRKVIERQ